MKGGRVGDRYCGGRSSRKTGGSSETICKEQVSLVPVDEKKRSELSFKFAGAMLVAEKDESTNELLIPKLILNHDGDLLGVGFDSEESEKSAAANAKMPSEQRLARTLSTMVMNTNNEIVAMIMNGRYIDWDDVYLLTNLIRWYLRNSLMPSEISQNMYSCPLKSKKQRP